MFVYETEYDFIDTLMKSMYVENDVEVTVIKALKNAGWHSSEIFPCVVVKQSESYPVLARELENGVISSRDAIVVQSAVKFYNYKIDLKAAIMKGKTRNIITVIDAKDYVEVNNYHDYIDKLVEGALATSV